MRRAFPLCMMLAVALLPAFAQGMVREQLAETSDASTSSNEVAALVEAFRCFFRTAALLSLILLAPSGSLSGYSEIEQ